MSDPPRKSEREPDGGRIDCLTESQFKDAVHKRAVKDRAVSSADHKEILSAAKKERMLMMGRDAGSTHDVADCTVADYEKCLGVEDLQNCTIPGCPAQPHAYLTCHEKST